MPAPVSHSPCQQWVVRGELEGPGLLQAQGDSLCVQVRYLAARGRWLVPVPAEWLSAPSLSPSWHPPCWHLNGVIKRAHRAGFQSWFCH